MNKFPDLVRYIVRRLKLLCPRLGKVKIAEILCRAGLHLAPTTVGRFLRADLRWPEPVAVAVAPGPVVKARRPNELWHIDLTAVPTGLGFWTSWCPHALPQEWPFCWWVAVVLDHTRGASRDGWSSATNPTLERCALSSAGRRDELEQLLATS